MVTLNILFVAAEKIRFPVFCKYPMQCNPQPAYITLDLETGSIDADYSAEIGNAVTSRVWHNIVLRFTINPESTADQIEEIIAGNTATFQRILDGAEIVNNVGVLNEDARDAYNSTEDGFYTSYGGGMIGDLGSWFDGPGFLPEGKTLQEYADSIFALDGENGYFFADHLDYPEKIGSALLSLWAEYLYAGYDIPNNVANLLLESGICNDSAWLDELQEFAM